MKNKVWILAGVAAPVVYLLVVVLGGLLRPGYSHVLQAISELIETGAPNKSVLDPLFAAYNLLLLAFAIGFFQLARTGVHDKGGVNGILGTLFLIAEGIFGFLTVFFPQDIPGTPFTTTGTMHIVLAGLSSLTSMSSMLFLGLWFRNKPDLWAYGLYTFISLAVVFLSGGMAAASIPNRLPLGGLFERITIGAFLGWLLAVALKLYALEGKVAASSGD